MNQAIYSALKLEEYPEVSEIANDSFMFGTRGILLYKLFPRIRFELFQP